MTTKKKKTARPRQSEATKPQMIAGRLQAATIPGGIGSANRQAYRAPHTMRTWREIRCDPTIALARMVLTMPIRQSTASVIASGDDIELTDTHQAIIDHAESLWARYVEDAAYSIDFGWQPFEVVWEGSDGLLLPCKFKPLVQERTEILSDLNGNLLGLKNNDIELNLPNSLIVSYDAEAGDWFGRSIFLNVIEAFEKYCETRAKCDQYLMNASGPIPVIYYPMGCAEDGTPHSDIAQRILENLGRGGGVTIPVSSDGIVEEMARMGIAMKDATAWRIDYIEASANKGGEYLAIIKHFESLMLRGMLVPERAAIEGSHGTLAEAEAHAGLVETHQEYVLRVVAEGFRHVLQQACALNLGEDRKYDLDVRTEPLIDDKALMLRDILKQILTAPANFVEVSGLIDLEEIAESCGIPLRDDREDDDLTGFIRGASGDERTTDGDGGGSGFGTGEQV